MGLTKSPTYWFQRNVLVTGCTGLLGPWLTQSLVEGGARVAGIVRDSVPRSNLELFGLASRIAVVRGDIAEYDLVERTLNEYEIDTVFHLAAQTIVGIANNGPLSTFETNIKGTWNLLEAARRLPTVRSIIVASSDKAYGDQPVLPYREDAPLQGRHPYDVSKSCADLIASAYFHTYRLPVCVTRCGNLFGGGDLHFNRLVPGTIRSVENGEPPVLRSDGTFLRDYLYVRDAVDAYMTVAEAMQDDQLHGEAFNFSLERPLTVLQMTRAILAAMDCEDVVPTILNAAHGEIQHQYLSSEKARRVLGWTPACGLEEGLKETVQWYRGYLGDRGSRHHTVASNS